LTRLHLRLAELLLILLGLLEQLRLLLLHRLSSDNCCRSL
jgi:hypothetical protein